MACNSSDILATAYRNGYAKLSERDLKVAAIAAACSSSCNAQVLIETAVSLGYLKLTEYEAAECIASALCSSPGASGAPAPTILKSAMSNHLASMSRRDLDAVITAVLCKQTNPPCVTPTAPVSSAGAKSIGNTSFRIVWSQPANSGSLITTYTIKWGTVSGVYPNSVTVPAVPRVYDLTGLTPGTQYFWVVVANSPAAPGCSSANSNEGSATTTSTGNHLLSGLVSYWSFDANAGATFPDLVDTNPLTFGGGVYPNAGIINNSFFYGANGAITLNPCPANMQLGAGKSFTISTWWNGNGGVPQEGAMGQFNNVAATSAWIIYITAGTSNLQFGGFTGGVQSTIANFGVMSAAWHHVVFGYDSANSRLFAYFDNGAIQTQATPGDLNGVAAQFSGGQVTGQGQYQGAVDETGFWNRVLSAADVATLFNGGAGLGFGSFTP